jgi:asparagine synthase (glutamine-hydrolysing)
MCGLFGVISSGTDLSEDELASARQALTALRHRGPDQSGEFVGVGVYIGHRRLSILDLSESGRQPMVSSDGRVVICVNGEIYNYKQLRAELGESLFRSHSDSEVVLHGYRRWGIDGLLQRLEGMYAVIVHDLHLRRTFLFRDRIGIKPLYFSPLRGRLTWASELKALTTFFGSQTLAVDKTALFDFLTYRYVPSPKTLYRDIYKLEPAHVAEFDSDGRIKLREYWKLEPPVSGYDGRQHPETLVAEKLTSSILEQLVSDVPVGFFLSGGIDSSGIVSLAVGAGVNAEAYSIGFDVPEHDETQYAELVARHLNIPHYVRKLSIEDSKDVVDWLCAMFDEPFADPSALATYRLAAFARERVTVALSGDGGDELFGGYKWYGRYRRSRVLRTLGKVLLPISIAQRPFTRAPQRLVQKLSNRLLVIAQREDISAFQTMTPGLSPGERNRYRTALDIPQDYDALWHFRKHFKPEFGPLKSLQYLDLKTFLCDDVLTKLDRVTMAVSLEARVPFLSTPLVELAFSLPEQFHFAGGRLKAGLKCALKGSVPGAVINRPKKGFGLPTQVWGRSFLGGQATLAEALLVRRYGVVV